MHWSQNCSTPLEECFPLNKRKPSSLPPFPFPVSAARSLLGAVGPGLTAEHEKFRGMLWATEEGHAKKAQVTQGGKKQRSLPP